MDVRVTVPDPVTLPALAPCDVEVGSEDIELLCAAPVCVEAEDDCRALPDVEAPVAVCSDAGSEPASMEGNPSNSLATLFSGSSGLYISWVCNGAALTAHRVIARSKGTRCKGCILLELRYVLLSLQRLNERTNTIDV